MLAVILVIVVGTIRLVGSNANNAFSNVAKFASIVPLTPPAHSPPRVSVDITRHKLLLRIPNKRDFRILQTGTPYTVFVPTFASFGYANSCLQLVEFFVGPLSTAAS